MNELTNAVPTMTSLELVEFINAERGDGAADLRHDNFMAKVPKVLGEDHALKLKGMVDVVIGSGAVRQSPIYRFPKREACLMAMSYSYDLQAKVFDRMTALEQSAANVLDMLPPEKRILVQLMLDAEIAARRAAAQEAQLAAHSDSIKRLEAKQQAFEEGSRYFTVVGFCVWRELPALSIDAAARVGKRATALSKQRGILVDHVRDQRFGKVNAYHEDILQEAYDAYLRETI